MSTIIEDVPVRLAPVCDGEGETIEVHLTAVNGAFDDCIVVNHADGDRRSNLVMVENRRGKLTCVIWANKGTAEPTHEIEVEAAQYEEVADAAGAGPAL